VSANHGVEAGGVANVGTITITRGTFRDNSATSRGAAIWNLGDATLDMVTFVSNQASGLDSAVLHNGGGVLRATRCTITASFDTTAVFNLAGAAQLRECTIADNGGGVVNDGMLSLIDCTLRDNADIFAKRPGLYNRGTATILSTTISGHAARKGAGLMNEGTITLINSTISGNRADGSGGGVFNLGTLRLGNVTIANNVANRDRASSEDGGGIFNSVSGSVELSNTILAGNTDLEGRAHDCSGIVTSHGHNLIQDSRGCIRLGVATGDHLGHDAYLGSLQDNGGKTWTHALMDDSPALDNGDASTDGSALGSCAPTDQRGVPRPHGLRCDIGAYELTLHCGNGQIDTPEECDDGNAAPRDCCSRTCQFERATLAGDANCDGRATSADLTQIVRLLGDGTRSPCHLDDANGDCRLDARDLSAAVDALQAP